MLVYRYLATHALDTIRDQRFKTSRLSDLNDPFEGMFGMPNEFPARRARAHVEKQVKKAAIQFSPDLAKFRPDLNQVVRSFVKNYPEKRNETLNSWSKARDEFLRVVSFSSSEAQPHEEVLLWSHYANHHRGFRLGFEVQPLKASSHELAAVIYSKERVMIDLDEDDDFAGKKMYSAYKTKSSVWSYEFEHRLLINPKYCERVSINGRTCEFFRYPHDWLRSIDFGARCPASEIAPILSYLKANNRAVTARKAAYHHANFSLEYTEL